MQTKSKNSGASLLKMLIVTTLSAILTAAVFLLLAAFLLDQFTLNAFWVRLLIYATYLASGITSGLVAGKIKRERKFIWGFIAGFVWFLVVLLISILGADGRMEYRELFPAICCMTGGGMLGGMLA